MARLHALDWQPFADDPAALAAAGPYALADAFLAEGRAFVDRLKLPGFGPVVDWLAAHRDRAACARPAVTHGDFHPANVLVRADGSAVVIDWPGLWVRDARTDLGWTLMLTQCFAGPEMRAAVLAGYEEARGAAVEHLDYFEVQACARRLADLTVSLTLGPERMGMRPAAAALMREQMPAMAAAAEMLHARTGLRVPEAEALLGRAAEV
jgi:aminoglycoside phosphotransferase (APT) family kinase protein